jgi:SAM-dependent methyltransferase
MLRNKYLMESDDEIFRLELKTDSNNVAKQALWAGLKPGMRVADIGCGAGKTTAILNRLIQTSGSVVGIDGSTQRIKHAEDQYGGTGIEFACKDILQPLDDLGMFDFIWVRFFLEYHRTECVEIVKNLTNILKPGGILCLVDLDYNCLSHYGLSQRLENTLLSAMKVLQEKANFDPYMGRKLYSFLYDLGYQEIKVDVGAHHLIYGELHDTDAFNWLKKVEVVSGKINYSFEEYAGGYPEFLDEFRTFFADHRRFTYSPIISCRGIKPVA